MTSQDRFGEWPLRTGSHGFMITPGGALRRLSASDQDQFEDLGCGQLKRIAFESSLGDCPAAELQREVSGRAVQCRARSV